MMEYYLELRSSLLSSQMKRLEGFELWDRQEMIMDRESVGKVKRNIDEFLGNLVPYFEGMEIFTFQTYLQQITYCLGIITLPTMTSSDILTIYQPMLSGTLLRHVS